MKKKRKITKKPLKYIKIFLKKKKKKSGKMAMNVTKNFQKMKNKSLLSIEKIMWNEKKGFIKIISKYFDLENLAPL